MAKPSIALVSAHYYPDYQRRNLSEIRRLKRTIAVDRHVGVLNAGRDLIPGNTDGHGIEWVDHDNEGQEFGAYQRGLEALLEGERPDWVIFMNDTIGTHARIPSSAMTRLKRVLDQPQGDLPMAVGYVDSSGRPTQINGLRGNRWIRTHIVALNHLAVQSLDARVRIAEIDPVISGGDTEASFFADDCDVGLRAVLRSWLFHPGGHVKWYRAAPLTSGNCAMFSRKARAIVQEFYMAFRLESAAARFIDLRATALVDKARDRLETEWFFRTNRSSIRAAN